MRGGQRVLVYEYGCRLDAQSQQLADGQIHLARQLYQDLILLMRAIHAEARLWLHERLPEASKGLPAKLDDLSRACAAARSAGDEPGLQAALAARRATKTLLHDALAPLRKAHAAELRQRFYGRIGSRTTADTYKLRCAAVDEGLGWASANRAHQRALAAYKTSLTASGHPPRPVDPEAIRFDTVTLQFTDAGGIAPDRIFDGQHPEIVMQLPSAPGRRAYAPFEFRLGRASRQEYAKGTWLFHRPLPPGARVVLAQLVRRQHADKFRWALQLTVRIPEGSGPARAAAPTLAALHLGWSAGADGREIAGVAISADPLAASIFRLPVDVDHDLARAEAIQSERDLARTDALARLRAIASIGLQGASAEALALISELSSAPPQHVATRRLYEAQALLAATGMRLDWLDRWIAEDRKAWQAAVGVARRARARRRQFYREAARTLAKSHGAIVLDAPDLAAARRVRDASTGKLTPLNSAARRSQRVAALSEFELALAEACTTHGAALFRMRGERTVTACACCQGSRVAPVPDTHDLACPDCGVQCSRKQMGAARAWQIMSADLPHELQRHREAMAGAHQAVAEAKRLAAERAAAGRVSARQATRPH